MSFIKLTRARRVVGQPNSFAPGDPYIVNTNHIISFYEIRINDTSKGTLLETSPGGESPLVHVIETPAEVLDLCQPSSVPPTPSTTLADETCSTKQPEQPRPIETSDR